MKKSFKILGIFCLVSFLFITISCNNIFISDNAVIELSQTSYAFGSVDGGIEVMAEITVTNSGSKLLEISSFVFSGDNADEFTTDVETLSIESSATGVFNVIFCPITDGEKTATLTIKSNLDDATITVTGTGENAVVSIPDANFKTLLVQKTTLNTNNDNSIQVTEAASFNGALDVSSNGIGDLSGIEYFVELTRLDCSDNELTTLNLSQNTELTAVDCSENENLTTIEVLSQDTTSWAIGSAALIVYVPDENFLAGLTDSDTGIDTDTDGVISLAEAQAATDLSVPDMEILDLTGIEAFSKLKNLDCSNNELTELDIRYNYALITLNCSGNDGIFVYATSAQATTVIGYDSNDYLVNFADEDFKTYLLEEYPSIDDNGDDEIQVFEAELLTGILDVHGQGLISLKGIEAFKNITNLQCYCNNLTSLDLIKNTSLTKLNCNDNDIASLTVPASLLELLCVKNEIETFKISAATGLTYIECRNNKITSLDISPFTALNTLDCSYNTDLTELTMPVASSTNLLTLYCNNCSLEEIDLTTETAIETLDCRYNYFESLDISALPSLQTFNCSYNGNLYELTMHSSVANALENFDCSYCVLTDSVLDVSNETSLLILDCSDNDLVSLDISALNIVKTVDCSNNTDLTTLVLHSDSSNDLTSLDCSNCSLVDGTLTVAKEIYLLTLDCHENALPTLDVSNNASLTTLYCSDNALTSLDVSTNTNISTLDCSDNTVLTSISCDNNNLVTLTLSNVTGLTSLICSHNLLSTLDLSDCILLEILNCSDNSFTSLNVTYNVALASLDCTNNEDLITIICADADTIPAGWSKDSTATYE